MKNTLTIYASDNTKTVYRNVENFQTLENGVSIFDVGPDTLLVIRSDFEGRDLQAGTRVHFKRNFVYIDYTQTAKPKSYGGGPW